MFMHPLVPAFILEQYANGETAGSFDACTLFVDISGFTAITNVVMGHGQHGAEVLANIIQEVFDPLIQSVFEHNGFVTNLAGDAFTAVFPTNNQSPDAFQHALAARFMQASHRGEIWLDENVAGRRSSHFRRRYRLPRNQPR